MVIHRLSPQLAPLSLLVGTAYHTYSYRLDVSAPPPPPQPASFVKNPPRWRRQQNSKSVPHETPTTSLHPTHNTLTRSIIIIAPGSPKSPHPPNTFTTPHPASPSFLPSHLSACATFFFFSFHHSPGGYRTDTFFTRIQFSTAHGAYGRGQYAYHTP